MKYLEETNYVNTIVCTIGNWEILKDLGLTFGNEYRNVS